MGIELLKNPSGMTRLGFFKRVAVGAVCAAAGALSTKETDVIKKGLVTKLGIFHPFYKIRGQELNETDLLRPDGLEGVLNEGNLSSFPDAVLELLAKMGIKVILDDVSIGAELARNSGKFIDPLEMAVLATVASKIIMERFDSDRNFELDLLNQKVTRRKVIKIVAVTTAVIVSVPQAFKVVDKAISGIPIQRTDAVQRIYSRLAGFVEGNLSPDNHKLFLRNVLRALKMLTVAEAMGKDRCRKPEIAFKVGSEHAGIEDFLRAGPEFLISILSHYPLDILEQGIKEAGGKENFCTARVLTLPPGLKAKELRSLDPAKLKEERITNKPLLEMLRLKFADRDQEQLRNRKEDIQQAKDILAKYLSDSVNTEIAVILDGFKTINADDYQRVFNVVHAKGGEGNDTFNRFLMTLPAGRLQDSERLPLLLVIETFTKEGQPTTTSISFYTDPFSDPSQVSTAQLKSLVSQYFKDAPEEDTKWPNVSSASESKVIKTDGMITKEFGISIDYSGRGRVWLSVHPSNYP